MTLLLASVRDLQEAWIAVEGGADIIDLKEPAHGALGALSPWEVAHIVRSLDGARPVSAVCGDLPMQPEMVRAAAEAMAAAGVDYVKIGFFPDGDWEGVIRALQPLARESRLIGVLFGDDAPDPAWIDRLAGAGFAGVMLDTRDKSTGPLTAVCSLDHLCRCARRAAGHRLLFGLAGSLRAADLASLLPLNPAYLGFRGALCAGGRADRLDPAALHAIRARMPRTETTARAISASDKPGVPT